jgi:exosortase/archaeosortase family protein
MKNKLGPQKTLFNSHLQFLFHPLCQYKTMLKLNVAHFVCSSFVLLHLFLVKQTGLDALIFDALLLWPMVVSWAIIQKAKASQQFPTALSVSMFVGLIISCILWGQQELFLRMYPLIAVASLVIAFRGPITLRKVLPILLLCSLMLPTRDMLATQAWLAEPTAKFANSILSLGGLDIDRQQANLTMSEHIVRILPECASVGSMRRMLLLGIGFTLIQPTSFVKNLWIPLLTCFYAFTANGLRVAALVGVKVTDNNTAFTFWHDGLGAKCLPVVALIPLLVVYWLISQKNFPQRSTAKIQPI